ncbi:MAG: protein kinase domain-containing protein [Phenylobacterium sp.]|uniref:protein kinase domain-containing protein n=1 Tax=Phenylobacterium sp. TaxID=1871053 RepID=UPI003919ABFE
MDEDRDFEGALHRYRFGTAEFNEARFELRVDGRPVELERRPLEVLAMLLQHAGEIVTKAELLESVWAGRVTVENVLANAVAKLRKGLGEANAGLIHTQARVGYRIVAQIERMAVGRRPVNRLELKAGQRVPGRSHFILRRQLDGTRGSEVWLARHDKTGEPRVYKFSPDGGRLSALKREATLSRVLRESLGDRRDMVRIIDWNFEIPPYFLECEYGGQSLVEWADESDRLAALPIAGRLDLALQAIDAVAAAHEVGVLHKDIKPSNVLVAAGEDGGWQVRITDFGAGRLIAPGRLEELGVTPLGLTLDEAASSETSLGTPLYIAPEILAGRTPTARSDVYSLGVLLYQVLAGDIRKPLTTGWEQDVGDPLLREDIAQSTSGDPASRLASAAELADRLRSLEARRVERRRLEEAEHRALAASRALDRMRARRPWAAATFAALVLGLGASLWLYDRASQAQRAAEAQAARAQATGAFLTDLLVNADPARPDGGGSVTVREALDRAAGAIGERFATDPATEIAIRLTAGDIYGGLADHGRAVEHRRRAAALLERAHGPADPRTLQARYRLAEALANGSEYDEAKAVLDAADRDAAAAGRSDDALTYVAAQARGRFRLMQADIEPAAAQFEEALRLQASAAPDDLQTAYRLRMDLAQCYSRLGRHDEAVEMLAGLQDATYAEAGVSQGRQASAALYHGAALLYAGRYEEAEPALLKATERLKAAFGANSSQVLEAQSALGNLYATSGRWSKAAPLISAVRKDMCALHGADHLTCMMSSGNEGVIQLHLGEIQAAIRSLAPAREAFVRRLGPESPAVHVLGYYLAEAQLQAGRVEAAAPLVAALDPAKLESGSPGDRWNLRVAGLKGRVLLGSGRPEGLALLADAVAEMERSELQAWIVEPHRKALAQACAQAKAACANRRSE